MCTLSILRTDRDHPRLIVAANRDERKARPSTPPRVWDDPVPFLAGRDEEAGGTWLGANHRGLVVGLTNQWTGDPPDPDRQSRGGIVRELLAFETLDRAVAHLESMDASRTNPFLLLLADADGRAHWASSTDRLRAQSIEEPIFSLGNRAPDDPSGHDRKPEVMRRVLEPEWKKLGQEDDEAVIERLGRALATHEGSRGPDESPCVHTERGFGTVSASILLLGRNPDRWRYFHADGPPCQNRFRDYSELWSELWPR